MTKKSASGLKALYGTSEPPEIVERVKIGRFAIELRGGPRGLLNKRGQPTPLFVFLKALQR